MSKKSSVCVCVPLTPTHRNTCRDVASALDCAISLNNQNKQPRPDILQLKEAVSKLTNHAIGYCKCTSPSSAYLAAASCEFHLFLRTTELNITEVIVEEIVSCKSLSDAPEDKTDNDQFVSNAPKDGSRFDGSTLPHLVNRSRQNQILEPLDNMLALLEYACKSKFSKEYVRELRIQDHLRSAYYAYQLYRVVSNQHRCAILVKKMSSGSSDTLRSCYFNMSIALQTGDIEMAVAFKNEAEKHDVIKNTDTSLNIDSTLFLYLSIETDLRRGIDRGVFLHEFLNSPAIQKVTVNRYFLKAVGLMLASKFPGDFGYRHDKYFKEMIDPHCMSLYMVKRWNKKLVDLKSQAEMNSDELLDPIWLRFATYNLFFESYVTISSFHSKTGNPSEITYFHEAAIRLCREHCLLYWLRKVLIIGSEIDTLMGKLDYAHYKLTNALDLIDHESSKSVVLIGSNNVRRGVEEEELSWKLSTVELGKYSGEEGDCLHSRDVVSWEIKKAAMKQDFEESPEESLHSRDYLSSEPIECNIFGADVDRLEAMMRLIMLKNKTPFERVSQLTKITFGINLKSSYKIISAIRKLNQREMTMERAKIFSQEAITFLSLNLRTFRSCLIIENGLSSSADVSKHVKAGQSVFEKEYNQRLDLVGGYVSRIIYAHFCLLHATAIYKPSSNMSECSPLSLYEELSTKKTIDPERTPSPPRTRRSTRQPPPRAPKGKNPYKMEEFQDYFKNLNQNNFHEKARNCGNFNLAQRYKKILDDISLRDASFECENPGDKKPKRTISKSVSQIKQVSRMVTKSVGEEFSSNDGPIEIELFKSFAALKPESSAILFALTKLSKYIGNHPPSEFYRKVNQLFVQLFLDVSIPNPRLASYHFSELASTSFRYRFMKMMTKRLKTGKSIKYPLQDMEFQTEVDGNYVQKVLEQCPQRWRILQLELTDYQIDARSGKAASLPDLLISRYEYGRSSLVLKIKSDRNKYLKDFMGEMKEIVELSNASTRERDPTSFWKVRTALDIRLENLLKSVENAWLGPFKGLFLGCVHDSSFVDITRKVRKAISKIAEVLPQANIDQELLRVLVESSSVLSEDDFKVGIANLFNSFDSALLDQVWQMNTSALNEYYEVYNSRLVSPVALVLGKGLEMFPWESLPVARATKQEYLRTPSLRFLSSSLSAFKKENYTTVGLNPQSTFYLVNPTANLPNTEEKFKVKMARQKGWTGVVGRSPKVEEFVEGLETRDIYIYFGHGAGTDYCKRVKENLEGINVNTASLVIGCSSGRLRSDGDQLEPHGPAYKFLSNGSPSFVGVLWDVTDRDIDLFSDRMLSHVYPRWGDKTTVIDKKSRKASSRVMEQVGSSICRAVAEAREACRLKYLIGAATVVYGLPIRVSHQIENDYSTNNLL